MAKPVSEAPPEQASSEGKVYHDNSRENIEKCSGLVQVEDAETGRIYTAICEDTHPHQMEKVMVQGVLVARTIASGLARFYPRESSIRMRIAGAQERRRKRSVQGTLLERAGVQQPREEWYAELTKKAMQCRHELDRLLPEDKMPKRLPWHQRGTEAYAEREAERRDYKRKRIRTLQELHRKIMGSTTRVVGQRPDIYGETQAPPF